MKIRSHYRPVTKDACPLHEEHSSQLPFQLWIGVKETSSPELPPLFTNFVIFGSQLAKMASVCLTVK